MFALRVNVGFGKTHCCQAHNIRSRAQIREGTRRIRLHALKIAVGEFAQLGRFGGCDPVGTSILATLQVHITVVFGFEDLDRAFFAQQAMAGL